MLLDVSASVAPLVSHVGQLLGVAPAAIPLWDQYVDFMEWALNSLANIFHNGGLGIIAFTIIIKTMLLPLTVKSTRSSKNMQELAPKIKEIQKKHGTDRQRASQETMALYQAHGVNPLSGCLPMIIQIPIFFGLYRAIVNLSNSEIGHWTDGFLWLTDLSKPDPWHILPIMAGLFQFVQSRMMRPANQKVTDPQQQIMNTMMNFMPLMVVVFGWGFASGPVIYWATQSVYSVAQQWIITGWGSLGEWFPWLPELPEHRRLGYQAPRNIEDVVVVSGEPVEQKGFSGWMQRKMQDAQQKAEARQQDAKKPRQESPPTGKGSDVAVVDGNGASDEPAVPKRKGTSYQDRVDAAAKFNGTPSASANGATSGADPNPNSKASRKAKRKTPEAGETPDA